MKVDHCFLLTHSILVDSSTVIYWCKTICHFRGVGSIVLLLFYFKWKILLANSVDPDQMPHVASDLRLHYLPVTLLRVYW